MPVSLYCVSQGSDSFVMSHDHPPLEGKRERGLLSVQHSDQVCLEAAPTISAHISWTRTQLHDPSYVQGMQEMQISCKI